MLNRSKLNLLAQGSFIRMMTSKSPVGTMDDAFNGQILAEKLSKINKSEQSISSILNFSKCYMNDQLFELDYGNKIPYNSVAVNRQKNSYENFDVQ